MLYDLPRAPRPDPERVAPVRFLPRYDELLIAYEHRDRVIAAPHRPAVYSKNAIIEAVFLVDGFAAGTWGLRRAKSEALLVVSPFGHLSPKDRAAVRDEAELLARFLAPDATTIGVRLQ